MFKFLQRLSRQFHSQSGSIFISDSEDCPCSKTYNLLKEDKQLISLSLKETEGDDTIEKVRKIRSLGNVILFMHGEEHSLKFYFLKFNPLRNRNEKVYIKDNWINLFKKEKRNIYFHVCYGANILTNNLNVKGIINSWVAHNDKLFGFNSTNSKIKSIKYKFLCRISEESSEKTSPSSLKSAIIASYYSLKSDLEELRSEDNSRMNCNKAYVNTIIACIGKNINSISSSS